MVRYRQTEKSDRSSELALRLKMSQSPEMARTVDRLYTKYGKYAGPLAELRKSLNKEMGQKTLTEELYSMREGR